MRKGERSMRKIKTFLCFLLIAVCLAGMIPAAYAAEEFCTMWNMETISNQNISEYTYFVDTFGYEYSSAVCFDVTLGSGATYDLSGQYARFTGTLTTSEKTKSDVQFNFAILLDGKIAYSMKEMTKQTKPDTIDLDLNGATFQRAYVFYVESTTNMDTLKWNYVMRGAKAVAGAPFSETDNWKAFKEYDKLTNWVVPEAEGTYIMFLNYVDVNGVAQQRSIVLG